MQATVSSIARSEARNDAVLLVDDNRAIVDLLTAKILEESDFRVISADTLAKARVILAQERDEVFCAVLDLNLPDAPDGEVVDHVLDLGIPVLVVTGNLSDRAREQVLAKPVLDYVIKHNASELDYVVRAITRRYHAGTIGVLVVDDAASARGYLRRLLEIQGYRVYEAENGQKALEILDIHPSIRIVVTDYHMPHMNGQELTFAIRKKRGRNDLAVIGLSGEDGKQLSVQLLKAGANDFLAKPFEAEEFICRINQNIDLLEQIQTMQDSANQDYLTRLYNRRYLFEVGKTLLANARRGNIGLSAAVLDLDHFKGINDRYGHDGGDQVLQHVAMVLQQSFREADIVARMGGEEFCVLSPNLQGERAIKVFNRVRARIERQSIHFRGEQIRVTCSIGVCMNWHSDLHEMIRNADQALYRAKVEGRNRVHGC